MNLGELTYRVAREMGGGVLFEGVATGGSETTIVDTNRAEADDYWVNGTAWLVSTTDGLKPIWEMSRISAWDVDNWTATLETTLTAAVAALDRYALCKKRYPLNNVLIPSVNNALAEMGLVPHEDTSSHVTEANETEYTLASAINGRELRQVWIQRVDDADNNKWEELFNWGVAFGDVAVADTLILRRQPPTGKKLRLVYMKPHDGMFLFSDPLNEHVAISRVVYAAALDAIKWYRDKTRLEDFDKKIDELENKKAKAEVLYPIPYPQKPGRSLMGYGYG